MSDNNTARHFDNDFIRKLHENAYTSHIKFAPNEAKAAWNAYVDAVANGSSRSLAAATQQAEAAVSKSLTELCDVLTSVSPLASLELLFGERRDRLDEYVIPKGAETVSLARGAWLIGVFGDGEDSSRYGALNAFNKYVRWVTAYLVKLHISSHAIEDKTERNIAGNKSQLEINRLVEPETRMMWIADEITQHIGRWVDANSALTKLPGVLDAQISQLIGENAERAQVALKAALWNKSPTISESFSATLLDGLPERLVQSLTAPNMQITESNVELALKGEGPTTTPFVRIGDTVSILGRSAWLLQRDDALFRIVMQASPRGKEGQVFEDVAASLLREWGPDGITWESSVDLVSPLRGKDTDDVDVLGCSADLAFIGECKANRLSDNNSSVGANFETVVLNKAVSQLDTRVKHWGQGWRPLPMTQDDTEDVTGFAVTFSSYGGMLWNADRLRKNDAPGQFTVIPLHSLVLAVSIIDQPRGLKSYFDFRLESMANGATNMDELEYMLGFVSTLGNATIVPEESARILFRQYELSDEGVWLDPRVYADRRNWKIRFLSEIWENTNAVTPPLD